MEARMLIIKMDTILALPEDQDETWSKERFAEIPHSTRLHTCQLIANCCIFFSLLSSSPAPAWACFGPIDGGQICGRGLEAGSQKIPGGNHRRKKPLPHRLVLQWGVPFTIPRETNTENPSGRRRGAAKGIEKQRRVIVAGDQSPVSTPPPKAPTLSDARLHSHPPSPTRDGSSPKCFLQ